MRPEPEVIRIADLIEDRLQDTLIDAPGPDELCALLLVAARVVVRQTQHAGEEHLTEGAKLATALFLDIGSISFGEVLHGLEFHRLRGPTSPFVCLRPGER